MNHTFIDAVTGAQITNGVVRIQFGVSKSGKDSENNVEVNPTIELAMPIVAFTDLANSCMRIGAELVSRGILKSNEVAASNAEDAKSPASS